MKENKYGIIVTFVLTVLSLIGIILFSFWEATSWWQSFSFAILGGSLCSLIIFIVNYRISMKRCAEEIAQSAYEFNSISYSNFFSANSDAELEKMMRVLGIMEQIAYAIYIKTDEFKHSVLIRKKLKFKNNKIIRVGTEKYITALHINFAIELTIKKIKSAGFYIEKYTEEAKKNTQKIYSELDELISSDDIYLETIYLAKLFKSKIDSEQEQEDIEALKVEVANEFKKTLEK